MKKSIVAMAIVAITATFAFAGWQEDFQQAYEAENVQVAVEGALEQGIAPEKIVEQGLSDKLNPENLVQALYCAGVSGIDIRAAAEKYEIRDIIVAAAHKKSVEECGEQVVDTQAYQTRTRQQNRFFNLPSNGGGGGGPASPAAP